MKKYICLLLVFALMLSLSTAAFAEDKIENSGQEPAALIEEPAPAEDNEPPPELTENIEENEENGASAFGEDIPEEPDSEDTVTEPEEPGGEGIVSEPEEQDVADHENENAATPSDAEKSPEQSEDDPEMTEDDPLTRMASPPENGVDDGTEEAHVVTVSWVIEEAVIDIASSSSYVWSTETLQYEEQSLESAALGSRRTVGVSITITNQFGCAVGYSIAYDPDSSVLENSEASSGESGSSGRIENGATLTYTGTVTVTGISNGEALVDGAVITLGTYSVIISSAESS